jgi:hypothetical protein
MEAEPLIAVLAIVLIFVGLVYNQIWLSIVFFAVLMAALLSGKESGKSPAPSGPAVRPIIVKRKYVGPESIYPKEMKVRITAEDFGSGMPWKISAPQRFGEGFGKMLKRLFGD